MSLIYANSLHAAGAVNGTTGAAIGAAGFAPARTAKGTYTLTLDEAVDSTQCAIEVTALGATPSMVSVEHTSDTVKTVHMADNAGAAADVDFSVVITRLPG